MVAWLLNAVLTVLSCVIIITATLSNAAPLKENYDNSPHGYSIHVGAFAEERNAERLTAKLQAKGIDAFYFKRENGVYVVRFGDYPTREKAINAARKLASDKVIDSYFIVAPQNVSLEKKQMELSKEQTAQPAKALEVTMTLRAEGTSKPFINGTTNLPNGSELFVNVWRSDPPYGWRNVVIVKNGKFRIGPLQKRSPFKGSGAYQMWYPFSPGLCNVQIGFTPVRQSKKVLAIVGENGSNLRGPLVDDKFNIRCVFYNVQLEIGVEASSSD